MLKIGIATPPRHFDTTMMLILDAFDSQVDVNQNIIRHEGFAYGPKHFRAGLANFRVALIDLAEANADVVVQMGSPFIYFNEHGYLGAKEWQRDLELETGKPVVVPALAITRILQRLEVRRLAISGMYFSDSWLLAMRKFIEEAGVGVEHVNNYLSLGLHTGLSDEYQAQAPLHSVSIMSDALRATRAAAPDSEAILISGLAGPIGRKYAALEAELGVPIISIENALLWELSGRFELTGDLSDFGHAATLPYT